MHYTENFSAVKIENFIRVPTIYVLDIPVGGLRGYTSKRHVILIRLMKCLKYWLSASVRLAQNIVR